MNIPHKQTGDKLFAGEVNQIVDSIDTTITLDHSMTGYVHDDKAVYACDTTNGEIVIDVEFSNNASFIVKDANKTFNNTRRVQVRFLDTNGGVAHILYLNKRNKSFNVFQEVSGVLIASSSASNPIWFYNQAPGGGVVAINSTHTASEDFPLIDDPIDPVSDIQEAYDNAESGDIIWIGAGENIITQPITLHRNIDITFKSVGTWSTVGYASYSNSNGMVFDGYSHSGSSSDTHNLKFENIGCVNSGSYAIYIRSGNAYENIGSDGKAAFSNNGWTGNRMSTRDAQTDTWANGGTLGYDSTQADLQAFYASTEVGGGGASRIRSVKYVKIESECKFGLRSHRVQDCGQNGGSVEIDIYSHDNIESGIYLASGSYNASSGCENVTVRGRSEYNANNGLLIVGGINIRAIDLIVKGNWNAGIMAWHGTEITNDGMIIENNNRSAFNGIGNTGDAKASVYIAGNTSKSEGRFLFHQRNADIMNTGIGSATQSWGIHIAASLDDIINDNRRIVFNNNFIDGQDIVLKSECNLDIVHLTVGPQVLGENNQEVVSGTGQGEYHGAINSIVFDSLKEVDLGLDIKNNIVLIKEGPTGHTIGAYPVNLIEAEASGADVMFKMVGSLLAIIDKVPLSGLTINGNLVSSTQSTALSELNAILANSGGGGGSLTGLKWVYDSSTTASDPGAGNLRTNTGKIYISSESTNGSEHDNLFEKLVTNNTVYLMQGNDDTKFIGGTISSVVDNTGWFTFNITEDTTGAAFDNGADLSVTVNTPGNAVIPPAQNTTGLVKWSDNSLWTSPNFSGAGDLYYGVALNRNYELTIDNYFQLNGTSGFWQIGLRDMTVSPAFSWAKTVRFNPSQIFADNTLGTFTEGFDTSNDNAIPHNHSSNVVLKYDGVDNKLKFYNREGPILNPLLDAINPEDGNAVSVSTNGLDAITCPTPNITISQSKNNWFTPTGSIYIGPTFGHQLSYLSYEEPISPGYSFTWRNNQNGSGGTLFPRIRVNGVTTAQFNVTRYTIRVLSGFTWEQSGTSYAIDNGTYVEYAHESDGYIRLYVYQTSDAKVLLATSSQTYATHKLEITTGSTQCEVPLILCSTSGKWQTKHQRSPLQPLSIANGMLDNQVIQLKDPIKVGSQAAFSLGSITQNLRIGSWKSANTVFGLNDVQNTTYWDDQLLYNSNGYLTNVDDWDFNTSNSLWNNGNTRWENDTTTEVHLRNMLDNSVVLYDATKNEAIATRVADSTGNIELALAASDTAGIPATDIFSPVISEIGAPATWSIVNEYTAQNNPTIDGLKQSNALTSNIPLTVGNKISFVLPKGGYPFWLAMEYNPPSTPVSDPENPLYVGDVVPYNNVLGANVYIAQSQAYGWVFNTANADYGGAFGGSWKCPGGGFIDAPMRMEYGTDQKIRMYDDASGELVMTKSDLIAVGASAYMTIISYNSTIIPFLRLPTQIISSI